MVRSDFTISWFFKKIWNFKNVIFIILYSFLNINILKHHYFHKHLWCEISDIFWTYFLDKFRIAHKVRKEVRVSKRFLKMPSSPTWLVHNTPSLIKASRSWFWSNFEVFISFWGAVDFIVIIQTAEDFLKIPDVSINRSDDFKRHSIRIGILV